MSNTRFAALAGIVLMAAMSRVVPHPFNVTPIAAMALFGGAMFANRRTALLVPLAAMLVSDMVLGFHRQVPVVYLCFLVTVMIGRLVAEHRTVVSVASAAMGSSFFFFIVTNASVWAFDGLYPRTGAGLIACFIAAIPFFQNALVGDLAYTAVLFGGFALLERLVPQLQETTI